MAKDEPYIDLNKTIIRNSKGRRITDSYIEKSLKETENYRKKLRERFDDKDSLTENFEPNTTTLRAMKEAKSNRTIKVKNVKELFKQFK